MSVPWGFGSLDRVAFGLINGTWTHPTLDLLMSGLTDLNRAPWFRYGVAPAAVALWLYKGRKQALRVLVVAAIAIGVCDLLAARVIKPWAARPRPQYAGIGAIVRGQSGGTYGFPSNHATNTAAAAAVLSVAYPAAGFAFWTVAGLVAYSRVYCGVHYPFDVLAGMALGGLLSWPWAALMLGGKGGGSSKKKKKS
ncbi:MAG: phosphatase PAP2 family protein [Elusimicrobia bacterium]|nr:phosphatase PAP2 family protein [Elusimicrobiota bacterium]